MLGIRRLSSRYVIAFGVFAAGCGGGGTGPGIVNTPAVVSVTIGTPATNPIEISGTVQLTVDVQVQNGAAQTVEWTSNAPNVATVSQTGLVTGVAGGQTIITATSTVNRARSHTVTITVSPPRVVGVTLNSGARTIAVGANFAVLATVERTGTLARTVAFTSSNLAVATVATTDGLTGTITGVGGGQTTITATSTVDATKSVAIQVTVTGTVRISNISPVSIRPGSSFRIVPTVSPDPGISAAVTFTSQNTGIATVAADGTVTGVALGQTFVVVRSVGDPNVSVNVQVSVRTGVTSVTLTPDQESVRKGGTRQLTLAVVADAGVSTAVNLTSANAAVATIDATARVTAVGIGQTFVRALSAIDPSVGDSTLIIVVDPCLPSNFSPLTFGLQVSSSISDTSCNGVSEGFAIVLGTQTTFGVSSTVQFPANFTSFGDRNSSYFFTLATPGSSATGLVVAAPGRYFARVQAQNTSQRGNFSILTSTNVNLPSACNILATTGVTVQVPINTCSFVPQGKAGTFFSLNVQLVPFFQTGERLTLTITAPPPLIPYVEVRFNNGPALVATGTTQTLVQSFTANVNGDARFVISTRDANQNGNFSVKIEGPPPVAFDSFVFGAGLISVTDRVALPGPRVQR